jgi:hypothetical protein
MTEVAVRSKLVRTAVGVALAAAFLAAPSTPAGGQQALGKAKVKGQPITDLLSSGGLAAVKGKQPTAVAPGRESFVEPSAPLTESANKFVNDPCLDPSPDEPFPLNFFDVVQSETSIAIWNNGGGAGHRRLVAGYNDSRGFTTNTGGLSGVSYSTDNGNTWINAGALPPKFPDTGPPPPGRLGFDQYFGDPSVVVNQQTGEFFYAGIYLAPKGYFTLGVSRGVFAQAPQQQTETESITTIRCGLNPNKFGVPQPPGPTQKRIIWGEPVQAVVPPFLDPAGLLDKELLGIDQKTGKLYLTYTNFLSTGETPLEMVVSDDGGQTWSPPRTIVPNELDTFNQATMPVVTPTGRVIVAWWSRVFDLGTGALVDADVEIAYSDDDGLTWTPEIKVADGDPQGEPIGYNRGRTLILNAPSIAVDLGRDDGRHTAAEKSRPGFGNVYVGFYQGVTPLPASSFAKDADIFVARSTDNGATWDAPVLVNDDATATTHLFPTVAVNQDGAVFVSWIDRRRDPVNNIFNDTYAAMSTDLGSTFGPNVRQSDIASTSWFTRADAAPNFGDYNQSAILEWTDYVILWADGRFLPPGRSTAVRVNTKATPDVLFMQARGLTP